MYKCQLCSSEASLRCMDCGPWFLLCSVCDNTIHSNRPCHDREAWLGDRFHPISPTQSVDSQGAIVKQGLFFLFVFSYISEHCYFKFIAFVCCSAWPECCPHCHRHEGFDIHPSATTRIIVTLKGTYVVQ